MFTHTANAEQFRPEAWSCSYWNAYFKPTINPMESFTSACSLFKQQNSRNRLFLGSFFPGVEFKTHFPWKSVTQTLKSRGNKPHSTALSCRWNTEPSTWFLVSNLEAKGMNFQHCGTLYRTLRSWPKLFQEKKILISENDFQILDYI